MFSKTLIVLVVLCSLHSIYSASIPPAPSNDKCFSPEATKEMVRAATELITEVDVNRTILCETITDLENTIDNALEQASQNFEKVRCKIDQIKATIADRKNVSCPTDGQKKCLETIEKQVKELEDALCKAQEECGDLNEAKKKLEEIRCLVNDLSKWGCIILTKKEECRNEHKTDEHCAISCVTDGMKDLKCQIQQQLDKINDLAQQIRDDACKLIQCSECHSKELLERACKYSDQFDECWKCNAPKAM
ncbi:hypothetical protein CBL_01567 [Carabus blaptoides fortunei]